MCCLFTCCGWMVDLVQRFWTFTMSCCISSAICCMLITASMAGVALGYNYSLAEYMDLKETNVSVFMKRGIFDEEISDLQFRRAEDISEKNIQIGESTPYMRSGRRLDDSVFETGDQHRYEGNLMKLTAKPAYSVTPLPGITDDLEMAKIATAYEHGSLDSLKAIQGLIDARKSMANRLAGGTTVSPVPTYPFDAAERMYHNAGGRRVMPNVDYKTALGVNPARLAVPNSDIGSRLNWQMPKNPEAYGKVMKDFGLEHEPITYPSPIPLNTGPVRPTPTSLTPGRDVIYLTRGEPLKFFSTAATAASVITELPNVESFKEKLILENEMVPRRKAKTKSEDDYDYDVKGLPVRKRRSIGSNLPIIRHKLYHNKNTEADTDNSKNNPVGNQISIKMTLFSLNINEQLNKDPSYLDRQENNKSIILHEENLGTEVKNNVASDIKQEIRNKDVIAQLLTKLDT